MFIINCSCQEVNHGFRKDITLRYTTLYYDHLDNTHVSIIIIKVFLLFCSNLAILLYGKHKSQSALLDGLYALYLSK